VSTASGDRDWPGAAPNVAAKDDFDEVLRHALRAAADRVQPAGDGLTQIFRRLAAPRLVRQLYLLAADCADLLQLITIWLEPIFSCATSALAAVCGSVRKALRRLPSQMAAPALIFSGRRRSGQDSAFRSRSQPLQARTRAGAAAWLRPALTVAVTAAIVTTGAVALRQTVVGIDLTDNGDVGTSAVAGGAPATGSHQQSAPGNLSGSSRAQMSSSWPGTTPASGGVVPHRDSCVATSCLSLPAGAPASGPVLAPSAQSTPPPSPSPASFSPTPAASSPSPASSSPSPAPTPTPVPSDHPPHQHPHPHQHKPHPPRPGPAKTPAH
jgi:hypothetical protein